MKSKFFMVVFVCVLKTVAALASEQVIIQGTIPEGVYIKDGSVAYFKSPKKILQICDGPRHCMDFKNEVKKVNVKIQSGQYVIALDKNVKSNWKLSSVRLEIGLKRNTDASYDHVVVEIKLSEQAQKSIYFVDLIDRSFASSSVKEANRIQIADTNGEQDQINKNFSVDVVIDDNGGIIDLNLLGS